MPDLEVQLMSGGDRCREGCVPPGDPMCKCWGALQELGLNCSSSIILCARPPPGTKGPSVHGRRERQGVARRLGQGNWVNLVMPERKAGVVGPL